MMNKVKQFFKSKNVRRVLSIASVMAVMACMGCVYASADAATSEDITAGVQQVTDAVTSQFSISTIASIVGIVLAACVGLFLFWWGARKVIRMITSAFTKGKVSLG